MKFEDIAKDCPWQRRAVTEDDYGYIVVDERGGCCCGTNDECAESNCAVWHFVKAIQPKEHITDGHGNLWSKYCDCGAEIEIVRPGKAQCSGGCE
jgi:hypothetical protein